MSNLIEELSKRVLGEGASEICVSCKECCRWLQFTQSDASREVMDISIELYRARGCEVYEKTTSTIVIMVPTTCPHLDEEIGCKIYAKRPKACVIFDGRLDPYTNCKLPKE